VYEDPQEEISRSALFLNLTNAVFGI